MPISSINPMMPSTSAEQWGSAANQQAAAQYRQAELAAGIPQATADQLASAAAHNKAAAEGQQIVNQTSQIQLDQYRAQMAGLSNWNNAVVQKNMARVQANQPAPAQQAPQAPAVQAQGTPQQGQPLTTGDFSRYEHAQENAAGPAPEGSTDQAAPSPQPAPPTEYKAAQEPDPTNPTHIEQHLATSPNLTGTMPNFYSDENLDLGVQAQLDAGVPIQKALEWKAGMIAARSTQAQNIAKVAYEEAHARKEGYDATDAAVKAAAAAREHRQNSASDAYKLVVSKDPSTQALGLSQAAALGYDVSKPEGLQQLQSDAMSSKSMQEQQETQRKLADTASEIKRRADETRIGMMNANTSRGQLAVSQGTLQVARVKEAEALNEKAAASVSLIDRTNQARDDINIVTTLLKNGALKAGPGGAYFVAAENLPPSAKAAVVKYLGADVASGKTNITDTLLKRIEGSLTELELSNLSITGQKGAGTSDKRMELAHNALTGKLDLSSGRNIDGILNSLQYASDYAKAIRDRNTQVLDGNNRALVEIGKGVYQPLKPSYTPQTSGELPSNTGTPTPSGGTARVQLGVPGGPSASMPIVTSEAAYKALPNGAKYYGADGKTLYTKGQ
jgi:hypothetical protein